MKKLTADITAAVFILGSIATLAACGRVTDDKDKKVTGTSVTSGVEDVHVFYYTNSDEYLSSLRSELDKEFKLAGINCHNYDCNSDRETRTRQVKTAVENGAKAIVVDFAANDSEAAAKEIVDLARSAGIPVIFFNREVPDEVVSSYNKCAFVGTDTESAGHLQGKMIGEYLIGNYDSYDLNKDGKISYVMLKGEEENQEAVNRTRYAVEDADAVLSSAGKTALDFYDHSNNKKYLVDEEGKWSYEAGKKHVAAVLKTNSEEKKNMPELIICNNDDMAEGAIAALNEAGYNKGETGSRTIPVFGADATGTARELISAGKMAGTVRQDAEGEAKAIVHITKNALDSSKDLMADTGNYTIDKAVNKIRIAYNKLMGQ